MTCKMDVAQGPDYYLGKYGVKAWSVLANFFPRDPQESMIWGQVVLYLLRYDKKDGLKDLLKAQTWLEQLIKLRGGMGHDSIFGSAIGPAAGVVQDRTEVPQEFLGASLGNELPGQSPKDPDPAGEARIFDVIRKPPVRPGTKPGY